MRRRGELGEWLDDEGILSLGFSLLDSIVRGDLAAAQSAWK